MEDGGFSAEGEAYIAVGGALVGVGVGWGGEPKGGAGAWKAEEGNGVGAECWDAGFVIGRVVVNY